MKIIKDKIINENYSSYLSDESKLKGETLEIIFPDNLVELQELIIDYNKKRQKITISNGRTGIVGGAVPNQTSLISLDKFNQIKLINEKKLQVGAAASLDEIDKFCNTQTPDYYFPIDVTETSSRIGGNIATDASGSRSFYYGSTRKWVNAIKVILADGQIFDIQRGQHLAQGRELSFLNFSLILPALKEIKVKNKAGYYIKENMDLIDLFIGSEGTLGIIIEAEILLANKPKDNISLICFFYLLKDVLDFYFLILDKLKNAYAYEFFDEYSIKCLAEDFPVKDYKFGLFIEVENTEENLEIIMQLMEKTHSSIDNTWFGDNIKMQTIIKNFRHQLPEKVNQIIAEKQRFFPEIHKVATDIAVPLENLYKMISYYYEILNKEKINFVLFGHIGEAHLHLNMLPNDKNQFLKSNELLELFVKKAIFLEGTFTAEHGVGQLKKPFMKLLYSPQEIEGMWQIKKTLDPNLILNPGVMFE